MYQNGIADMPWNLAQIFKWAKNFVKNLRGQVASSIEIIFPSFSETFFKSVTSHQLTDDKHSPNYLWPSILLQWVMNTNGFIF